MKLGKDLKDYGVCKNMNIPPPMQSNAFNNIYNTLHSIRVERDQWKVLGVLQIYKRSVEERCLRYTTYLGDGDSKSFQDVVNANPYPGKTCNRYERVGHVQKRVTAHINTLRQEYKGVMSADDKKNCAEMEDLHEKQLIHYKIIME